jgi:putative acetyltransferase
MDLTTDDLSHPAVAELLAIHLDDMRANTPDEGVHALGLTELERPDITFWTAWDADTLLGCGALKDLDGSAGEIKSMRTHPHHVRKGVARAILDRIIETARERGYRRLSLETGSGPTFDAAVALYEALGFRRGDAFAHYERNDFSRFFHLELPRNGQDTEMG